MTCWKAADELNDRPVACRLVGAADGDEDPGPLKVPFEAGLWSEASACEVEAGAPLDGEPAVIVCLLVCVD